MPTSEEKLVALLQDLQTLASHLHGQGDKKLTQSRRFEENARRDSSNQDFDLRQATMLSYQHDILHEIGNQLDKLIKLYDRP